ncbi:MAG: helix-turn-helix domain-containing protein, partial [Kiritimatiellaeota bacterium]|nr:helix-turn-helix domain-containing protein [Kiritimatiellota bacterium]
MPELMDSIGQQLKAARERKGVTASQAAAATHLKVQHVEALEHDDYSRLTVPTYAKGFLKIYAEYLGLDPAPLLREYMARFATQPAAKPAAAPAAPSDGSVFKSPRRPLPGVPTRITLSSELVTRLLQAAVGIIVLLLLIWVVRHGCHRAPRQPVEGTPPPPAVTNQTRTETPPVVAPARHEQPTPWII